MGFLMRLSLKSILLTLSLSLILSVSCDKMDSSKSTEIINLEAAKIISHLPADILEPDAAIKIRFVDPVIEKKGIGASTLEDVLEFEPQIEGALSWQDERTLVLTPGANLESHNTYKAELNLEKVDAQKFKGVDPVSFEFRVAGQELTAFEADFELAEKGNPKKVYYAGTIDFALNIDLKIAREAIILKKGGTKIALKITAGATGKQVSFKSEQVIRNNIEKNFLLQISNEETGLPSVFSKAFKLPALQDLRINNIAKDESSDQPRIKIEFSDELDSEQNIDGFISVTPAIKFTFRKMGKTVYLNAPFEYGQSYTFKIQNGISSRWATKTTNPFSESITFEDLLPEIKFAQSGVILPSSNLQKVAFMTVNVRKVKIEVTQVFESNIGQFLQDANLGGDKDRNQEFYNRNRVGISLKKQTLEIGDTKNRWLQHDGSIGINFLRNPFSIYSSYGPCRKYSIILTGIQTDKLPRYGTFLSI